MHQTLAIILQQLCVMAKSVLQHWSQTVNGDIYEGEFKRGLLHGQGKLLYGKSRLILTENTHLGTTEHLNLLGKGLNISSNKWVKGERELKVFGGNEPKSA